jgi:TctA family transporter
MILLLEIICGVFLGCSLGLIPNLHLNSLAYFFLIGGLFLKFINYPYFFISFAITHTIVSFVPLCLLGVPNSENILHLFPTHKLFLKGEAKLSILLCMVGSFFGTLVSILFLPILYLLFNLLSTYSFFIYICLIVVLSQKSLLVIL